MEIHRLSAPLGAVIEDIDVTCIDADRFRELNALFCTHHVLVFPNQRLTPEQQLAFGRRWGQLVRNQENEPGRFRKEKYDQQIEYQQGKFFPQDEKEYTQKNQSSH